MEGERVRCEEGDLSVRSEGGGVRYEGAYEV